MTTLINTPRFSPIKLNLNQKTLCFLLELQRNELRESCYNFPDKGCGLILFISVMGVYQVSTKTQIVTNKDVRIFYRKSLF